MCKDQACVAEFVLVHVALFVHTAVCPSDIILDPLSFVDQLFRFLSERVRRVASRTSVSHRNRFA